MPRAAATRAAARRPRATPATTPAAGRRSSARTGTGSALRMPAVRHVSGVRTVADDLGGRSTRTEVRVHHFEGHVLGHC